MDDAQLTDNHVMQKSKNLTLYLHVRSALEEILKRMIKIPYRYVIKIFFTDI